MPRALVSETRILNEISKSGGFYESVVHLHVHEVFHDRKLFFNFFDNLWARFHQLVVCDSCREHMSGTPPSKGASQNLSCYQQSGFHI